MKEKGRVRETKNDGKGERQTEKIQKEKNQT